MVFGFYQAQAGGQVGLFVHLGTGTLQGGQVLFGLVFCKIALEGDRVAREQAFDLGAVAFEQARQVGFDLVQLRCGHQFAAENDLETGL